MISPNPWQSAYYYYTDLETGTLSTMTTPDTVEEPQRFDCSKGFLKEDARKAFLRDGSIIVTNIDSNNHKNNNHNSNDDENSKSNNWSEIAASVPTLVWDLHQLRLKTHRADPVHIEHKLSDLHGKALPPHTDGYMWGDRYPDLVILACEQQAPASGNDDGDDVYGGNVKKRKGNGASFVIDGHSVFRRLIPSTRELLEKELVDHTERKKKGAMVQGEQSIVPVIRYLEPKGWRRNHADADVGATDNDAAEASRKNLCWRRMTGKSSEYDVDDADDTKVKQLQVEYTSLWSPVRVVTPTNKNNNNNGTNDEDKIIAALLEVDSAIAAETAIAPRFVLKKGEALIVDNFRMLHSRDSFQVHDDNNDDNNTKKQQRMMWRVWSWTDASFGLPPQIKVSGENVPSNVFEARNEIPVEASLLM